MRAAQLWQDVAAQTEGGEAALTQAIRAAFDRGMLKRHPYSDAEEKFRPTFETFLAERRWEDPDPARSEKHSADDGLAAATERMLAHRRAEAQKLEPVSVEQIEQSRREALGR
jgi:hypothetical protein